MLTAHKGVETVVDAMKAGAFDYATKPFDLEDVALRVSHALETTRLRRELRTLKDSLGRPYGLESIIGESRRDAAPQGAGPSRRDEPKLDGAAHRRERHRQRSDRQGHSLRQQPRRPAIRQHHVARRCPSTCSNRRCSGTSAARSPMRGSRSAGCSNRPTKARCSSTRSARWCPPCSRSCCDFSRRKRSGASAARPTCASTSASSPRPTATSRSRSQSGKFRKISSTV